MKRTRSGPGIREFLRYYLLVLLARRTRSRQELARAIREASADNRSYRSSGVLWIAQAELERTLEQLADDGLVERRPRSGKWAILPAGRAKRWELEAGRHQRTAADGKGRAARRLLSLMGPAWPGARVLDVGTGQGFLALKLSKRGFDVLGIDSGSFDYSQESLEAAREQAHRQARPPEFRQAAVTELEGVDGSFDYVVSSQAIHCMTDQPACLRAMHRLLKPGGRLLCLDFYVGLDGYLQHGFHTFLAVSREEWLSLLPRCGFCEVRTHKVLDYLIAEARTAGPAQRAEGR